MRRSYRAAEFIETNYFDSARMLTLHGKRTLKSSGVLDWRDVSE
jgi:hypothetical protein